MQATSEESQSDTAAANTDDSTDVKVLLLNISNVITLSVKNRRHHSLVHIFFADVHDPHASVPRLPGRFYTPLQQE